MLKLNEVEARYDELERMLCDPAVLGDRKQYHQLVRTRPVWRELHGWIKSDDFAYGIMDTLREHQIDLGYHNMPAFKSLTRRFKDIGRGRFCARAPHLRARFEFSALPADGGQVVPHTDSLPKVATIIVSMVREGEWDPDFGGGTDVNRPKDLRTNFNEVNRLGRFEDMEVLDTFDFASNQGVIFIKTFNSWHCVRPMTGAGSGAMRKSLIINIEKPKSVML